MKLLNWSESPEPSVPEGGDVSRDIRELRGEPRHDCLGLKLIIRQRRAIGIIHLRNISTWGACGITDMPLAEEALCFLELKKGHFYAARVKWIERMTIGVQFVRQMRECTLARLLHAARKRR